MTENFDEIKRLQREYDNAFRTIALLIAKYGERDPLFPEKRIVRLDYDEMLSAPTSVIRWDEPGSGEMCLAVKVDSHEQ